MNQKKLYKITQAEIDIAKEEYFKNGGIITILKTQGLNLKKVTSTQNSGNTRNSS